MEDRERSVGDASVETSAAAADGALRLDAALLVLIWIGAIIGWSTLPETFPIHFDARGRPDSWVQRDAGGFVLWMLLPAIATITSVLLRLAVRWATRNPMYWNVPRKKEFLALTDAQRAPIVALLTRMLARVCVCTTLLLGLIIYGIWREAHEAGAAGWPMLIVILAYLIAVCGMAIGMNGRVRRMIEERTI